MPVFVIAYAVVLAAAALLSATVGVIAFRRHAAGQSGWLAACMAAAAGWAAVAAIEALVPTAPLKIFLSKMQYAAVVSVAPSWLMFGLAYAGLRCPRPLARGALLWIPSALTLVLVWTNEWHGWIWPWFGDPPLGRGPLVYGHGPAVAVFAAYSYLLTLAGTGLILRTAYRAPLSHRRHAVPIGTAALLPIVLNLSYLSGATPATGVDPTPVAFAISGALLAWVLMRQHFLSVPPIALAALFAGMREGVLVVSSDGRIAAANPAARRMLGLADDPAGEFLRARLEGHPALVEALATEGSHHVALPVAGATRWFDVSVEPLGEAPATADKLATLRDVTERTASETAVRRLTDRLMLATRSSGIGVWEFDASSENLLWDDRMREIYGWPAPSPVSLDVWYAMIHPDDRPRVRQEMDGFFAAGTQMSFEFRIRRPDRQVRLIRSIGVIERDAAGRTLRAVGTNLDITDARRIEREQAKLATAVEQSAEVTLITDPDGRIEYVNPAFERVTGYSRTEAIGQTPAILKSGRQDRALYDALWSTIRAGRTWTGHFVNRRKDGTLYEEDATISPVVDGAGRIVNFVAEKRDVTQERLLEAQLRQSQKMESVGRLAGGVAHDFNNNLQTILGFCELMLMHRPEGDPERDDLLQVQRAAENARRLTAQLLAFSRRQLILPTVLDLNALVGEQQLLFARTLGEDIRLDLRLDPVPALVKADSGQIQQVLLNLVLNARDAMPSGGRLLLATSRREFSAEDELPGSDVRRGRFLCLSVCDSGTGMTTETVAHLFEPFFTTKEAGKGTGLGLAVVHGIVKQHEGWVHVYTEPGQGTEFKVFLPAAETPGDSPAVLPASAAPAPRGRGERILLVEDEPGPRLVASRVLREHGYDVVEAGDAAEARRIFGSSPSLALVLSDVVLPDGNGFELALEFRRTRPALPVALMSGYADDRARWPEIRDRGFSFLQKPFSAGDLLGLVAHELA